MNSQNYFVCMDIEARGERICRLVWQDKIGHWLEVSKAEEFGFRGVSRMTSEEAYGLVEKMNDTKYLRAKAFAISTAGSLDVRVGYHDNRLIYVLFDWDEDEGANRPIAKVRCDGMWAAKKFFKKPEWPVESDSQILHIGHRLCHENWDEIAHLPLEADLILEVKRK